MDSYRKRRRDRFFGAVNYKGRRHGYVTYNSIVSTTSIFLLTNNVVDIKSKDRLSVFRVLALSKTKALPIYNHDSYKNVSYIDENGESKRAYLIKLNKADFMNVLTIDNEEYRNEVTIQYEDSFDSLFEQARIQSNKNYKVYFS